MQKETSETENCTDQDRTHSGMHNIKLSEGKLDSDFGSLFTQHSDVKSCPEDEWLRIGTTDKRLASPSA